MTRHAGGGVAWNKMNSFNVDSVCEETENKVIRGGEKMIKKCVAILVVLLLLSVSVPALAAINVTVDGVPLQFDVEPTIVSGRTMVPMRAIFEALGATVEWIGDEQKIVAKSKDEFGFEDTMELWINKTEVNVYGYRGVGMSIELDVPPMIINGRTMVPTRFVAESMGATVNWIAATSTVEIISASGTAPTAPTTPPTPPAPEANPLLEFDLQTGDYQDNDFVAEGTFTNIGNVKITQVDKVRIKIYMFNDEGDSALLADETFENIPVNLEPGQSEVYAFTFPDVTFYEDATRWDSEESDWLFSYVE